MRTLPVVSHCRFSPLCRSALLGLALVGLGMGLPPASWADMSASTDALGSGHTVNGYLVWADEIRLSTPVSGVLATIPVQAGETVAKGQVLFKLDRMPFNDRLSAAVAQHKGLIRAAAEAKRDAERAQQLYDRTVASDSERQDALIKQEKLEAQLKVTQATVNLRRWQRSHAEVVAPFSARILSVEGRVGEIVSTEFQPPVVMRIARSDQILARTMLNAESASRIHSGQTISVTVQGAVQEGKVVGISSLPDEAVGHAGQAYQLDILLPLRQGWLAGLPARIALP